MTSIGSGQEQVTWSGHIACLVYSHCSPCHNNNGIAPFPLQSYEDAYQFRYSMETAIANRHMPPWPPATDYSQLAGARVLSEQEIALFRAWVEQGAPEGVPEEAPETPVYSTNLEINQPDFSFRLPPFQIPDAKGHDLYRCFVIHTDEQEDRFITGIEIVPGNRAVVHHVILFQDTSGEPERLDAEDPSLGYTCFGGIGSDAASMVSGWVPGSSAYFAPDGMGVLLPKGATLVAQIHYPLGSAGKVDSTLINLQFSDRQDIRRIENLPALNHFFGIDRPLFIPANTRQTFYQTFFPVPFKVIITGIAPHAHLICESMKAFATTPQGDTIPLIDIPQWDFEWQGFYQFQKPMVIPALSTLHGVATYNNTTSNHHLPGDVPVDVSLGEATTDEMMLFFMSFSVYQDGDEDMIIDTSSHQPHHNQCVTGDFTLPVYDFNGESDVTISPNPAQTFVRVTQRVQDPGQVRFILLDLWGHVVSEHDLSGEITLIQLPAELPAGVYHYQMRSTISRPAGGGKLIILR